MILKPRLEDIKLIGYYLGRIILWLAITMLIPALIGAAFQEINPIFDFFIGALISAIFGLLLVKLCYSEKDLSWMQGMIVVSLSWLVAMVLGAIPLYLSGHWKSYLDACFLPCPVLPLKV